MIYVLGAMPRKDNAGQGRLTELETKSELPMGQCGIKFVHAT
jgi:hypothetical protein